MVDSNIPIVRDFRNRVLRFIKREKMCSFKSVSVLAARHFDEEDGDESARLVLHDLMEDDMVGELDPYYFISDNGENYLTTLEVMDA